ncbi:MAG: hypothetical protein IPI83_13965 [Sphingomonadales bacterium]|nr:hypothetical protein [Sphingomonadales bacterium]
MRARFRLLSTALGTMAGSAMPGGVAAAATPRLPIDPAAFSDDSLALPPPRLDYDPTILGMACSPADASCLGAEPAANLTGFDDVASRSGYARDWHAGPGLVSNCE